MRVAQGTKTVAIVNNSQGYVIKTRCEIFKNLKLETAK